MSLLSRLLFLEKKTLFPKVRSGLSIVSIPELQIPMPFTVLCVRPRKALRGGGSCTPDVKHNFSLNMEIPSESSFRARGDAMFYVH